MTAHILVIDDDPVQRRLLKNMIERSGHVAHMAENGRAGLDLLDRKGGLINVILLDLMMPEMNGSAFLDALAERENTIPVIVQTGQGGIETVVMAMRAGAFDFVVKPVSPERLNVAVGNALKMDQREGRGRGGRRGRSEAVHFDDIVSASPEMLRVIELGRRAAQSNIPVVLEGESGVGKEMVARAIQAASDRAQKPFVTVNCGAIPHNLVESILFGHEKGSFTGANSAGEGFFRAAHGGTLLLDEIAEMPLALQAKLLRALQEGEVVPIGATRPVKVDVRIIACANRDLPTEVEDGRFRADLYYRLNVFPLGLNALRERPQDIAALTFAMILRHSKGHPVPWLRSEALAMLKAHSWPGNIRELENVVRRALLLANGAEAIGPQHIVFDQVARMVSEPASISAAAPVVADGGKLSNIVQLSEARAILATLEACGGHRANAAKELGISERTLRYRLASFREAGIAVGGRQ